MAPPKWPDWLDENVQSVTNAEHGQPKSIAPPSSEARLFTKTHSEKTGEPPSVVQTAPPWLLARLSEKTQPLIVGDVRKHQIAPPSTV